MQDQLMMCKHPFNARLLGITCVKMANGIITHVPMPIMIKTCTCNLMWTVDQKPDNHLEWPYKYKCVYYNYVMTTTVEPTAHTMLA